jgi:putative hemolysin
MSALMYQNIGHFVLLLSLLASSAFFSGSETAFFNLTRRQIRLLQQSTHKLQNLVVKLLKKPSQLLNCLLFGNMCVNVLYYAVASVLIIRVGKQVGLTAAAIAAGVSFVVLLLFGEILPKSIAYANSRSLSIAAALPALLCKQVFAPFGFVFRFIFLEPVLRLFLGPIRKPKAMSIDEFKSLIDASRKRGLISDEENRLLTEVVELGFLKVRHVVRPRVDMPACAVTDTIQTAREIMQKHHLTKLPVYVQTIDNVVGIVHLRQLLLRPDTSLDKVVQPVHFVPEHKTVESLLEFFRKTQTDMAVVVDEYGGITGSVSLEDIAEELFGEAESDDGTEPIEKIGPLQYRLTGNLAIHEWADVFGISTAETRVATVGGLVTVLLGRIPKPGDSACLRNLKFTVESIQRHRIKSLILTIEPLQANDQ